jgi:hypothetical protein
MFSAVRIALLLLLASCVGVDPDELVVTSPEPAGVNCAAGGTRVDIGADADGDGELAAAEVEATNYKCDADDDDGTAGADTDGVGTSP